MKKRVAVIYGGCSSEHEISNQSAKAVLNHMDREKYDVIPIRISREGQWAWVREDGSLVSAFLSPNRQDHGMIYVEDGIRLLTLDCVLPVLHGRNGEDGSIQGLCQLAGIPLAGCGLLSSALCLHKHIAHQLVKDAGVDVPRAVLLRKDSSFDDWIEAVRPLGYPVFVKPVQEGSSVGIHKVLCEEELRNAVEDAFSYDDEVTVEEAVDGFEVGCAVLGNCNQTGERPLVSGPDEVELTDGWLDFEEKYQNRQNVKIHTQARISREDSQRIRQTVLHIYQTLRCSGIARVDMFLTPEGKIVFNEINTMPGLTVHSRYPKMLEASGIGFSEMIDRLIESAK